MAPRTAEEKEERRLAHLQRMTEGRKRKAKAGSSPKKSTKRKASKRKGVAPNPIAEEKGRPIGGKGKAMGTRGPAGGFTA